ncbi:MAG: hypothetical protein ACOCXR_02030 [Phototrophicaceae bacterium]
MATNTLSRCQNGTGSASGRERTRFFPRQLVTPDDMTQDQIYFREKSRRHNRLLHGWGIVCGAWVRPGESGCEVVVEPGYILGPYGDEIVIDDEITLDLCQEDPDGNVLSPCGDVDPWCSDVRISRRTGQPFYLAVRYAECQSRPVRVMPAGCGCDEAECEYSRIRDSFALKVLTELPASYDPMPVSDIELAVECPRQGDYDYRRHCPPCPDDPWVILATITLNDNGEIGEESLDMNSHRRYVVSFADVYVSCRPREELDHAVGSMRPSRNIHEIANLAMVEMINDSGYTVLERNYSGDISRATELAATEIRGVSANSTLGRAVADMTIAEIADLPLNEFISTVTASGDLSESDIASINRRAPEIHSRALRIANVAGSARRG